MVLHTIRADILLIARIFPCPFGPRKNTSQLAKYRRVLYVNPSNKMYLFLRSCIHLLIIILFFLKDKKGVITRSLPRSVSKDNRLGQKCGQTSVHCI